MQPWARRSFQAALVTGGVLAAGTGVASAAQTGPDRAGSPDLDQADGTQHSGFAGDLFTEASTPVKTLTGQLDPVRDVLPYVENDQTREMPALTQQGWIAPRSAVKPRSGQPRSGQTGSGQHAAADPDARTVRFRVDGGRGMTTVPLRRGLHAQHAQPRSASRGRHAAPSSDASASGTPADGFHRSLSWRGPIGDVLRNAESAGLLEPALDRAKEPVARDRVADAEQTSPFLPVVPDQRVAPDQPAVPGQPGVSDKPGVPALGGLIAPESVDLTSGKLAPATRTRTVPPDVLASARSEGRPRQMTRSETVPLQVPGEHQEKATDLPELTGAVLTAPPQVAARPDDFPAIAAQQSPLEKPLSRITGALIAPEQAVPQPVAAQPIAAQPSARAESGVPAFTERPLDVPATVRKLDPLSAVKAERDHVTDNPYRSEIGTRRAAAASLDRGMALPLLDGVTRRVIPGYENGEITDILPVLSAT